ncbi:MAG: acyltransferase [Muribaculaceae bacterium]|nr:acyltransferase [Muribaculaceae bacterium]
MIKTLTSWRGIFALCIVCFHFAMHEFDQMTYAGVTFFFMLSGFLVGLRHDSLISFSKFYKRRLWRIFPLHWIVLAAMILLDLVIIHKFKYGWDLPLHVVLLQSWSPDPAIIYNYSIHSWFLSSLLFCICVTPLLFKFFKHSERRVSWAVMLVACAIVVVVNLIANETWHSYLYVMPLTRVVDYALGMLLGMALRERQEQPRVSMTRATIIEVAVLLIFAIFIALHASGNAVALKLGHSAIWWIPVSLLIVTCTILNGNEGWVGKLLSLKPLVWLGTISFEIYLLQKLANNLYCYVVAPFSAHYGMFIYDYSFIGTLPLLIIMAWAVHKLMKLISPAK